MWHGAQNASAPLDEYIDRKKKHDFHHVEGDFYLSI